MTSPARPQPKQRIWDPLLRLFHWGLAGAFATAWFERSESAIHETAGKVVLGLLFFRMAWGLIGPDSARFRRFIKGPFTTLRYGFDILRGRPAHHLGHNPAGAAMIIALLLCLSVVVVSGLMMKTTLLWGNAWNEWLHGTAATVCVWLIAGHLLGVAAASFQHRELLPLAMITGRKMAAPDTKPHLGWRWPTKLGLFLLLFALPALGASLWVAHTLASASLWRMPRMALAAAKENKCTATTVTSTSLEVFPAVQLVMTLNQPENLRITVPWHSFMQRRTALPAQAFAACNAPPVDTPRRHFPFVSAPAGTALHAMALPADVKTAARAPMPPPLLVSPPKMIMQPLAPATIHRDSAHKGNDKKRKRRRRGRDH